MRLETQNQLEELRKSILSNQDENKQKILVCGGTGCLSNGSLDVVKVFEEEIKKLVHIQQTKGVLAADMMQTYQEELEGAIKDLEAADVVPDMLNMDSIDVRDIIYNGDLKKKDFHGGV